MADTVTNLSSNTLAQVVKHINDNIDKVYRVESKTGILSGLNNISQMGAGAHEIKIPKIETSGLKTYDKVTGYPRGYFKTTYETKTCDYDRGLKFNIDAVDLMENIPNTIATYTAEAVRNKFIPEWDAYHISKYVQKTASDNRANGTLGTGADVCNALIAATNKMDNNEVDMADRVLFITPDLATYVENMDTNKSKAILSRFMTVVRVPTPRMYSKITLLGDGGDFDSDGGYSAASGAVAVNFLIVSKAAALQYTKHVINKLFSPEENQQADMWTWCYRSYGICDIYDNKQNGLYVHTKTAIS